MTSCSTAAHITCSISRWAIEELWLVKVLDNPCRDDHRPIPLSLIVPNAGSAPLPATWISGRLLVGYGGFVENQNPRLKLPAISHAHCREGPDHEA
jgi:hypothetical protein